MGKKKSNTEWAKRIPVKPELTVRVSRDSSDKANSKAMKDIESLFDDAPRCDEEEQDIEEIEETEEVEDDSEENPPKPVKTKEQLSLEKKSREIEKQAQENYRQMIRDQEKDLGEFEKAEEKIQKEETSNEKEEKKESSETRKKNETKNLTLREEIEKMRGEQLQVMQIMKDEFSLKFKTMESQLERSLQQYNELVKIVNEIQKTPTNSGGRISPLKFIPEKSDTKEAREDWKHLTVAEKKDVNRLKTRLNLLYKRVPNKEITDEINQKEIELDNYRRDDLKRMKS